VLRTTSYHIQIPTNPPFRRAALKHHPDRVPADSPERAARTKKFQQINDAYYTLSDTQRRRDYDDARRYTSFASGTSSPSDSEDIPHQTPPGGFPWPNFDTEESHNTFSNEQFGSIFEEMLREEGMASGSNAAPTSKFWAVIGGLSGGAMGFIVANFPGMVAGAVAGNRLGAVRDARGKSVYQVFSELPQGDKARLLSQLAAKVFAHAVGGSS
jgi:curved DNA-binding protein CbpA